MNEFIEYLQGQKLLVGMVGLLIVLLIILAVRKKQEKALEVEMEGIEVSYNKLKSVPLTFKINKALALAKVDSNIKEEIMTYKDSYETSVKAISTIGSLYIEAEEALEDGDVKHVNNLIEEMDHLIELTESNVTELDKKLDSVLEQEQALRSHANDLKERFRQIKQGITAKSSVLAFSENVIDANVVRAENQFKAFEEWMFVSEFDKAEDSLETITNALNKLDEILVGVPQLLPIAQGVIPDKISKVSSLYSEVKNANVYLDHLDVTQTLKLQAEGLNSDLADLRAGEVEDVKGRLDDHVKVLQTVEESLTQELMSHREIIDRQKEVEERMEETLQRINDSTEKLNALYVNYEFDDLKEKNRKIELDAMDALKKYEVILTQFDSQTPSTQTMKILDDYYKELSMEYSRVLKVNQEITTIVNDEARAREHLLKLHLIINEVQVKINEYRLPSISSDYQADVKTAREHVKNINVLLNERYLDINLLNATLADAIDYIYKLYNNVNNIVGMAIMVENALVFANRYRSTYDDIDTDLTRSELAFRNGEYTNALTIVLEAIEKVHPVDYEKVIKENRSNVI